MIKRKASETSTSYANALGETALVGSRVEGVQRASILQFTVPVVDACDDCTIPQEVSVHVKIKVPEGFASTEITAALTRAVALIDLNYNASDLSAGPIELVIDDTVV